VKVSRRGAPTSGELTTMNGVTREGYTFQTVLGSMGLNHMNGRIEDSITGRFLSPDPHGTIRGNTQSWNRYSYVNNNPLTNSDPSGFAECGLNMPPNTQWACTGTPINWALAAPPGSSYSSYDMGAITDPPTPHGGDCGDCNGVKGSNTFDDPEAFNLNSGVGAATPPPSGAGDGSGDGTAGGAVSTSTTYVWGVGTQPATNTTSVENGIVTLTVGIYSSDAPRSPAPSGANLAPIFAGGNFAQYDPGLAALQTLGFGIATGALASGGVALAPVAASAVRGPALVALMELTSNRLLAYAQEEVVAAVYATVLADLEGLNAVFRALEVVEVAGPEIPW
jgi:RHS repeat-associated protein